MKLFILRHGEAQAVAREDSQRELTERGRREVVETLSGLAQELTQVERIYHSPYVRASQTASLASETLGIEDLRVTDLLLPCADPYQVVAMLESLLLEQVMLVSHQPLVGTLVDSLCGFEPGCYRMGTSAIANLSLDAIAYDMAKLNWLKQPGC